MNNCYKNLLNHQVTAHDTTHDGVRIYTDTSFYQRFKCR